LRVSSTAATDAAALLSRLTASRRHKHCSPVIVAPANQPLANRIAGAQAGYFVASGLWPLLHMASFEWVLGRKREHWLVRTVALLLLAIGTVLGIAAARRDADDHVVALGALAAAATGAISGVEAARGRISPLYLIDALIEAALVRAWLSVRHHR
jgi:hypothetical protein